MKTDSFIELQIGNIGKIDLPLEEVHSIEKNGRTGEDKPQTYVEPKGKTELVTGKKAVPPLRPSSVEKNGETKKDGGKEAAKGGKGDDAAVKEAEPGEKDADADGKKDEKKIDPDLKKRIEELVDELQRQKSRNRVQAERHLEAIGQPTIPFLLPLARNENELVRVAVMRLFHSFGDQRVIDAAITGLLDDNEYVRDSANKALKRITGEDFGYQASASPRRRENGHDKWADWWAKEKETMAAERKLSEKHR
jgi:hypothetical protein